MGTGYCYCLQLWNLFRNSFVTVAGCSRRGAMTIMVVVTYHHFLRCPNCWLRKPVKKRQHQEAPCVAFFFSSEHHRKVRLGCVWHPAVMWVRVRCCTHLFAQEGGRQSHALLRVLGILGPGQSGPGQLGPGQPGPGAQLSGAQFATDNWAPDNRAPGPHCPGPSCPGPNCLGPDCSGPNLPRIFATTWSTHCLFHKLQCTKSTVQGCFENQTCFPVICSRPNIFHDWEKQVFVHLWYSGPGWYTTIQYSMIQKHSTRTYSLTVLTKHITFITIVTTP